VTEAEPGGTTRSDQAPEAAEVSKWPSRAAQLYLLACGLALVAMLVETVAGHPGVGSMFAAILAVPWSMLVAGFAPPLPRDWPLAAGLVVRMVPLALFMLLNSAIVRGIAARTARDLARSATRVGLLCVVCALLGSGCALESRQEVMVAAPTDSFLFFFGDGRVEVYSTFDLNTSPTWVQHHKDIVRVTDVTLMGDFQNGTGGPVVGGPDEKPVPIDFTISIAPDPVTSAGPQFVVWGPLHLAERALKRVEWDEGQRLFNAQASVVRNEIAGDGHFTLYTETTLPAPTTGGVEIANLHLACTLEVN